MRCAGNLNGAGIAIRVVDKFSLTLLCQRTDDSLPGSDDIGFDLLGNRTSGSDGAEGATRGIRQINGARFAFEKFTGVVGDALHDCRYIEGGGNVAADFVQSGGLVGAAVGFFEETGVVQGSGGPRAEGRNCSR